MEWDLFSIVILIIAFVWSGFVRAGFGFGGAGLMFPIALLAIDSVIFLVPIVCIQFIIFSSHTLYKDHHLIDWRVVGSISLLIFPTFAIGVFGLINFAESWVLIVVYAAIAFYSLGYIFNFKNKKRRNWLDYPTLFIGGYVSGLSLSGSPLIAAVAIKRLQPHNFRASFFALWIGLVIIKLFTLWFYEVNLQLVHQLWLLPSAWVGHIIGIKMHNKLVQVKQVLFYRVLGIALLMLCCISAIRHFGFGHLTI